MMKKTLLALACATLPAQFAVAHHSSAPHYDASKPVSIVGEIVEFKFVNPHAYLYVNVENEDGTVSLWNCEFGAASQYRRDGWTKDIFEPGTTVSIQGSSARRDPHGCSFESGTLEDGTRIQRNTVIKERRVADSAAIAGDSIAGNWQTMPRGRPPAGGPPTGGPNRAMPDITDEHKAALEHYDMRFDDPALRCSPSSLVRVWSEPSGVSTIEVNDDTVVIRHEFMDTVRTIHLDGSAPPEGYEPGLSGYSTGRFEGKDLLIETTGFAAGVLMPHPGILHSEDMKMIERLSLNDDGSELRRAFEVIDPRYFNEPFTGANGWRRSSLSLAEYGCTELGGRSNERNPSD